MSPLESAWEGWSKLRRFYLAHFRKKYVIDMLRLRRGECRRCGMCCKFMFRCPHLEGENHCAIYDKRYTQCRLFPIDPGDLRGRFSACGYYFVTRTEAAREECRGDLTENPAC